MVNDQNILVGIVTDGDLRRLVSKDIKLLNQPVKMSMTKNPKLIKQDALAARAVEVMEHYNITSLFIVDEENRPQGIIHLHDLLKAGVV